jgi:hypothetical protein
MSPQVLLISQTKLKAYTTINQNMDEALLVSMIFIAQDLGLQTLIGTRGYNHYTNLVQANQLSGTTISTADRTMLDEYIAPYLIYRASYEAMPEMFARRMNKAIVVGNTEQGTSIDIKGMEYLRGIEQGRYNFYAQRIMDYILGNPSEYPWYYSFGNIEDMPPQKTQYFSGVWFTPGMRRPPRTGMIPSNMRAYIDPTLGGCVDCGF